MPRKPRPAAPLRSPLAERVAEQILRLIARGEYPKDNKLPTEAQLGARFGVSRPVIRAALDRLRAQGHVRSQQGSGTVVLKGPETGALVYPPIGSIADLERCFEFRIAVEGQSAFLAALHHTAAGLAEIEAALKEGEQAVKLGAPELGGDLNFKFHRAVARATRNPFFSITIELIPNLIGMGPVRVRNFGIDDPRARLAAIGAEHAHIFTAIRDRDGPRARAAMEAHIAGARQYIFEQQSVA